MHVRTSHDWHPTPIIQVHVNIYTYMDIQNVFLNIIQLSSNSMRADFVLWIHTGSDAGQWLEDDIYQQSWPNEIFFKKICVLHFFLYLSSDSQNNTIFSGNLRHFFFKNLNIAHILLVSTKFILRTAVHFLCIYHKPLQPHPILSLQGNQLTFCCIQFYSCLQGIVFLSKFKEFSKPSIVGGSSLLENHSKTGRKASISTLSAICHIHFHSLLVTTLMPDFFFLRQWQDM